MTLTIRFLLFFITFCALSARQVEDFNSSWRFDRFGPMPDGSRRAEPAGIAKPAFDDSRWRTVTLPHDWGIEGPFRADLPGDTGKLPWAGIGWYRKTFVAPASLGEQRVWLEIDGAMAQPEVFLNGTKVGEWKYGYTSFRVALTK